MDRDPLEYALNRMEAERDKPPPTVGYPGARKELLDGIAALRASIKEYEDAERWLKGHKELLAIHPYGKDGFALDFGHGSSAEVAYLTIPAAVAAAIREGKG